MGLFFFSNLPLFTYITTKRKSKLDYVLFCPTLENNIKSVTKEKLVMPEHSLVRISMLWKGPLHLCPSLWWRLNSDFIKWPTFQSLTLDLIKETDKYKGKCGDKLKLCTCTKNKFRREYKLYTRGYPMN